MAASLLISILSTLVISLSLTHAQYPSSSRPKALLLPISKDPSTLQYLTHLSLGTPPVPKTLVLDLGGANLWIDCDSQYNSSTYKPALCNSPPCKAANATLCTYCYHPPTPRPGCNDNICGIYTENPINSNSLGLREVSIDVIKLKSLNGFKYTTPNFIFGCVENSFLDRLAKGVSGMAGLGNPRIALPSQLSSAFGGSLPRKFALCLPSSPKNNGALFFGNAKYVFYPYYNKSKQIDVSDRFSYTKILVNPISIGGGSYYDEPDSEYFVGVTSMKINGKPIKLNTTLLPIMEYGFGGTKLSSVDPYTLLQTSIYKALTRAFDREMAAMKVKKVAAVAPFKECYSTEKMGYERLGPGVPSIAFVFENNKVEWEIYGSNSMVEINPNVVCLGFLDGGVRPRTTIVIGAHQMQDHLFEFNLPASRLAFTPSLSFMEIGCENYKF